MSGFEFRALPDLEAIAYFRTKGFSAALDRFSWKDVWGVEHDHAFTVAKAMRDDILKDIREAMTKALEEGTTFEDFRKELAPLLEEKGWWGKGTMIDPKTGLLEDVQLGSTRRLDIIYDTNLRTAHSAGRWARSQRNAALMPFFTYIQVERDTKRDAHQPFHGVTLPVDHAFWTTHWTPNGWRCGCIIRQISRRIMERDKLKLTDESEVAEISKTKPWTNDRTGEVVEVPMGIDPGFERNPGMARYNPVSGSFDAPRQMRPQDRS